MTPKPKARKRRERPYPSIPFEDALVLASAIQQYGSGEKTRRITLCDKLQKSPESSATRDLITNSAKYGITVGSYAAEHIELTEEGRAATDPEASPRARLRARFKLAIENIKPFAKLYESYKGKKMPEASVLRDVLQESGLSAEDAAEYADLFVVNAKFLGLLKLVAGSERLLSIEQLLEDTPDHARATSVEESGGGALSPVTSPQAARRQSDSPKSPSQWSKTCFVISPIGVDASEERKHADLILGSLIEPAAGPLGLTVVRADRIGKPGMITAQIVDYILNAGIVIADLSYHNPNVFYELALRHATLRPTIHVIRKVDTIPFDIGQFRTVRVDTTDIFTLVPQLDTYRAEIATQMRALLGQQSDSQNPLSVFCPGLKLVGPVPASATTEEKREPGGA